MDAHKSFSVRGCDIPMSAPGTRECPRRGHALVPARDVYMSPVGTKCKTVPVGGKTQTVPATDKLQNHPCLGLNAKPSPSGTKCRSSLPGTKHRFFNFAPNLFAEIRLRFCGNKFRNGENAGILRSVNELGKHGERRRRTSSCPLLKSIRLRFLPGSDEAQEDAFVSL